MPKNGLKKAEVSIRGQLMLDNMSYPIESSESESPPELSQRSASKKYKTSKQHINAKLKKPQKAKLAGQIQRRRSRDAQSLNPKKFVQDLVSFFSSIDSAEDMESWRQDQGLLTAEDVNQIEQACGDIARLLRTKRTEYGKPAKRSSNQQPFDNYYVHRDGTSRIMLLAPLEVFEAKTTVRSKTFGFVREGNDYWPLMCAISGSASSLQAHEKLLDNKFWSDQTFRMGKFHGVDFRTTGFEAYRNVPQGIDFASHVEPKLMLWYACFLLRQVTKESHPVEKEVGMLYKLREVPKDITVEIVISRAPCPNCKAFQQMIEGVTGLQFDFMIIPNLGVLNLQKNKYKRKVFPPYADLDSAGVVPDSEEEEERESQIQVVIRQKPTRESQAMITSSRQVQQRHEAHDSQIATRVTLLQDSKLEQFCRTPKDAEVRAKMRKQASVDYSYESDYTPTARAGSRSLTGSMSTSEKRMTRNSVLLTPDSTPFGFEALELAKKIHREKKKRLREREDSPTPAKKNRQNKF